MSQNRLTEVSQFLLLPTRVSQIHSPGWVKLFTRLARTTRNTSYVRAVIIYWMELSTLQCELHTLLDWTFFYISHFTASDKSYLALAEIEL